MIAVEVHNLRKEFLRRDAERTGLRRRRRRVPALEDVTFSIERGECVAILGQNGSGKSTLVRLLSTLLLHDGGSAHVFGHDVFKEIGLDVLDNQIDTLSKAFQATTVSCARCHDHKLDAISARDYYGLLGILVSTRQVVQTLGRIPRAGERFILHGFEFDVLAATATHVERVAVRPGPVKPVVLDRAEDVR